jgi:hypothetical protein
MEIREVAYGRAGLILVSKGYNQKYHLVAKHSDVEARDIVQANLIRDEDNYAIYECKKIPSSRMILKLVDFSFYNNNKNLAIWKGEEARFVAIPEQYVAIPEQYIECQTKIFTRYSNGFTQLALVKCGDEEAVWNLIKKSNAEKAAII